MTAFRAAPFKAACVQLCSTDDVAENIRDTIALVREAAARGSIFIATPENTTLMAPDGGAKLAQSYDETHDPALPVFSALATELKVWILIGSVAIKVSDSKTANRSFLFAPDGGIRARYSKIHLFDVQLASGEVYRESNTVAGGNEAVVADTELGKVGLSICYDLRFPILYRKLAQKGAFLFTVPSAFTVPTGSATRSAARPRHRQSHVAPWGEVLGEAGTEPGIIVADIDPALAAEARAKVPNLQHDREFAGP